jgi:hypothetical protein
LLLQVQLGSRVIETISLAMAELMAECYPRLTPKDDEYETMYKSLKNDLSKGRNWNLLQEKFLMES